jgi:hypothetical protein
VLAGDGAAVPDADPEDLPRQLLGRLLLPGNLGVVEHQGVEVAVAGVEHVGHPEPSLVREPGDLRQHPRDVLPGDDPVLDHVVGREPAHGGEGALPTLPHQHALVVALRDAHLE